jgi:protein gp37
MAFRLDQMGQEKYKGTTRKTEGGKIVWTGRINFDENALLEPLKWKKPQRVFVNSMSDLFHEDVPFDFIDKVFAVMALTPHITYQLLTKRPERMEEYFNGLEKSGLVANWGHGSLQFLWNSRLKEKHVLIYEAGFPLPNVWLGTTIENQAEADKRIPHLLNCPAAVRFVSCEPLVGKVDLWKSVAMATVGPNRTFTPAHEIHWVIAGGESGPNAEPSHPDWFRSLRDQCDAANVPFFFKQYGEYWPDDQMPFGCPAGQVKAKKGHGWHFEDAFMWNLGRKNAGNTLDGKVYNQFPEAGRNEGEK